MTDEELVFESIALIAAHQSAHEAFHQLMVWWFCLGILDVDAMAAITKIEIEI